MYICVCTRAFPQLADVELQCNHPTGLEAALRKSALEEIASLLRMVRLVALLGY